MKTKRTACFLSLLIVLCLLVSCAASDKGNNMPGDPDFNAGGMTGAPTEEIKPDGTVGEFERKVIRTVNMSCESKAFDDAVSVILTALQAHDGYVEASSSSGVAEKSVSPNESTGNARRVSYTLRIPAEKLDSFLNALRVDDGIRILSQDMTSTEITGSYYDAKTRLETLKAEKDSLTAMLSSFTDYDKISAMLEVQERLYDVIEEMEALQTTLNLYDSQVALSTVNLSLREVVEYTEVAEPTFGERIADAFKESWTDFGRGWQNFAVWFVEAFPTLLILGGIAAVVIVIVLREKRKRDAVRNKTNKN